MDWVAVIGGFIIAILLYNIWHAWRDSRAPAPEPAKWMVGDVTPASLAFHNGMDWSKPTLIAVKGILYDVTKSNDLYGPGEGAAVSVCCWPALDGSRWHAGCHIRRPEACSGCRSVWDTPWSSCSEQQRVTRTAR